MSFSLAVSNSVCKPAPLITEDVGDLQISYGDRGNSFVAYVNAPALRPVVGMVRVAALEWDPSRKAAPKLKLISGHAARKLTPVQIAETLRFINSIGSLRSDSFSCTVHSGENII